MAAENESESAESDFGASRFESTHWSLVLAAGQHSSPDSNQALSTLCGIYWYPLYAYVRRRVKEVHEAEDLTQAFFAQLLEKKSLAVAQAERGKFRSFLLTSLKNFLANEWDKSRTQKRGGGRTLIPLDFKSGESRFKLEPAHELTPERLYDKQWALTLLDHVLARLREEFVRVGKERHFELLKVFLTGEKAPTSYAQAADELGLTEGAVKVSVHRLRQRYRELLRVEITQTVAEPGEVEDEINSLFAVLGS